MAEQQKTGPFVYLTNETKPFSSNVGNTPVSSQLHRTDSTETDSDYLFIQRPIEEHQNNNEEGNSMGTPQNRSSTNTTTVASSINNGDEPKNESEEDLLLGKKRETRIKRKKHCYQGKHRNCRIAATVFVSIAITIIIASLIPPILYEPKPSIYVPSPPPPQSNLALLGDYISLHHDALSTTFWNYTSMNFTLQPPFDDSINVDIYCITPDQLHSVKRKVNFADLPRENYEVSQEPFQDRIYFDDCHYVGKCILGSFVYQAMSSVADLIFDISLNNFTSETYVNASIFDNYEDFQRYLHDGQKYNMVKNTRLNQQNFRLILEEAQMKRSTYYFIVLEDVVGASTWFTFQQSGLQVYYNASSYPSCCTMNKSNNYTCTFNDVHNDSVTYLARVRGEKDEMGEIPDPNDPPRYYISTTIANPLPTGVGQAIAWGSYGGFATVVVIVIVFVAGCVMMLKQPANTGAV